MRTCKTCGWPSSTNYCPKCGTLYIDENDTDLSYVTLSAEISDADREAETKRSLWNAMHTDNIVKPECLELARKLKSFAPNDYYAGFVEIACTGGDKEMSAFLNGSGGGTDSGIEMYADAVLDYLCTRMTVGLYYAVRSYKDRSFLKNDARYEDTIESYIPAAEKAKRERKARKDAAEEKRREEKASRKKEKLERVKHLATEKEERERRESERRRLKEELDRKGREKREAEKLKKKEQAEVARREKIEQAEKNKAAEKKRKEEEERAKKEEETRLERQRREAAAYAEISKRRAEGRRTEDEAERIARETYAAIERADRERREAEKRKAEEEVRRLASLSKKLTYTVTRYGCIVTGMGDCKERDLAIPEEYNGHPVVSIGKGAFRNCHFLHSVIIPDKVTSIDDAAFFGCVSLYNVAGMQSVCNIGKDAFRGCICLGGISLPPNVTRIGANAFYGCTSLKSVGLPSQLDFIEDCTFYGCGSLTEICIPDSVLSVGEDAFFGCQSMRTVVLGGGVASVKNGAFCRTGINTVFYGRYALDWSNINIENSNDELLNAKRYYYSRSRPHRAGYFWHVDRKNNIAVWPSPSPVFYDVVLEGKHLFRLNREESDGLRFKRVSDGWGVSGWKFFRRTCLVIPAKHKDEPVVEISSGALYEDINRYFNDVGKWWNKISMLAFITSVYIPYGVKSIGIKAFSSCGRISYVVIPGSVSSIHSNAFFGCDELNSIFYIGTEAQWNRIAVKKKNEEVLRAVKYFYSETRPSVPGKFWHFVGDEPTVWK